MNSIWIFVGFFFADSRVLMVPQAQLALQDREASWVFRVKEESAGCRDFLDLRCVLFYFIFFSNSQVFSSVH